MGTRAQFFINDPQNLETRKWLGCIAWDGRAQNFPELAGCKTEDEFSAAVQKIAADRNDFCDPTKHGFPFPWVTDLFLTDVTFALMDGRVMVTTFHRGWIPLADYLGSEEAQAAYYEGKEELPQDVPAPGETWDRSGPDSIIIFSVPR